MSSNENKMSDGHRERVWLEGKTFWPRKGERAAGGRSLHHLVRPTHNERIVCPCITR
jgi:hypothetical protein